LSNFFVKPNKMNAAASTKLFIIGAAACRALCLEEKKADPAFCACQIKAAADRISQKETPILEYNYG